MISLLCAIIASTQVYRLELTDEVPYIVGQDGVRREVCLVDPVQYAVMTGNVEKVWRSLNADENGRVRLHGKRMEQRIDTNSQEKVTVYEDGYCHSEKFSVRTVKNMDSFAGRGAVRDNKYLSSANVRNGRISERHQKMRDEIEARKKANPKIITIEHDATTGKDVVK